MAKYKLVALEQGWLDRFNEYLGTGYDNDEVFNEDETVSTDNFGEYGIQETVENFNNRVAQGPAIELVEVSDD